MLSSHAPRESENGYVGLRAKIAASESERLTLDPETCTLNPGP